MLQKSFPEHFPNFRHNYKRMRIHLVHGYTHFNNLRI